MAKSKMNILLHAATPKKIYLIKIIIATMMSVLLLSTRTYGWGGVNQLRTKRTGLVALSMLSKMMVSAARSRRTGLSSTGTRLLIGNLVTAITQFDRTTPLSHPAAFVKFRPVSSLNNHVTSSDAITEDIKQPQNATQTAETKKIILTELVKLLDDAALLIQSHELSTEELGIQLISTLMSKFERGQLVPEAYLKRLLHISTDRHKLLPNILHINSDHSQNLSGEVTVCGDTHGQYVDFIQIFDEKIGGFPSIHNKFVFNGDMVDRGPKATEIMILLLTMKVVNDESMWLLRGNHETSDMTSDFGFQNEVQGKYGLTMYYDFLEFFKAMPLGAVVEDQAFVVHGGLGRSTFNATLAELDEEDRFCIDADTPFLNDLLWPDPVPSFSGLFKSGKRGSGSIGFGEAATRNFLEKNNLSLIVRSHEMVMEGFNVTHGGAVLTVFSAANYCGVCKNKGAILKFRKENGNDLKVSVVQFKEASKKPYQPLTREITDDM